MSIIKLQPSYKEYIWGGRKLIDNFSKNFQGDVLAETWELSSHADGSGTIINGEFKGKSFREFIEEKGSEVLGKNCDKFEDFPILIKLIDAKENLSIQVHPDNEYALKNENQYGKTEMWYVLDCEEDAYLYYGFSKDVTKEEFKEKIQNGSLTDILNKVYVKKGDVFFIEAGTIHAIGKGIVIAEIQQNSNVTYRAYDYKRVDKDGNERQLHVEQAVAVTNLNKIKENNSPQPHVATCEYFTVDKVYLDGKLMKKLTGNVDENSFLSVLVTNGEGTIKSNDEVVSFVKGDSIFITANSGDYEIEGNLEALFTRI